MKVAYVVSGMKLTFVVGEMEAHEQAGWQVLPLASCPAPIEVRKEGSSLLKNTTGVARQLVRGGSLEGLSQVVRKWSERAIYRSSVVMQLWMTLREFATHPLRLLRICFWAAGLAVHSLSEFAKAVYELPTACDFAVHCRRFGAQHIHVHFASRSLSLGLMLGMLTDLPVSCTVHAFDIFTRSRGSLCPRLARCKFIVAVSQFNIDYLRWLCGSEVADLCHVVRCGIDLTKFSPAPIEAPATEFTEGKKYNTSSEFSVLSVAKIISVAKLVPKKGLDLAIQACAKLKEMNVDFLFEIVGDGPEREHLQQQIRQLGLAEQVVLLGSLPNDQLVPLLSKACVFLLPCVQVPPHQLSSRQRFLPWLRMRRSGGQLVRGDMDGIPVSMMEAMACEVPVVSRWISGIPELVHHNVNGLLVYEQDPAAIAQAVKELLLHPDKARQFGRAGRQLVQQRFDITKTAAQLRQLIWTYRYDSRFSPSVKHQG